MSSQEQAAGVAPADDFRRTFSKALRFQDLSGLAACALFVLFVGSAVYRQDLAILVIIYALLAIGMYVPLALGGRLSLAYNAYFAIGAYSVALMGPHGMFALWLAPVVGMAISMATATVLGYATRRLSGFHLAVSTLMFGIAVYTFLLRATSVTGGPEGLGNIPRLQLGDFTFGRTELIVVGALCVWLVACGVMRLRWSFAGISLRVQREAAPAALACGVPVGMLQTVGLALGAAIASLGGVFLALMNQFVLPESFAVKVVFLVLFMPILGGMSTPWGSVLGALIVVVVTLGFDFFAGPGVLTFGILALVILLIAPRGVLGLVAGLLAKTPLGKFFREGRP